MVKMPILSAEAVRALARATLGGPNCRHKDGFEKFLLAKDDVLLSELSPYFYYGPDTFLINYAVRHNKYNLGPEDIARAYCIDHILMVRAAEKIFSEKGFEDEYFQDMHERGFELTNESIDSYLFSCLGTIGQVVAVVRGSKINRLRIFCPYGDRDIEMLNACTLLDLKPQVWVAIHFASVFTELPKNIALAIIRQQQANKWFSGLIKRSQPPRQIDFTHCRRDLAAWTEKQLAPN